MSNDFFESQKGISDRRAARGFPPGPGGAGRGSGSSGDGDVAGQGGGLISALLLGTLVLMWKIAEVVLPILLMLLWEATKLTGQMLLAILSSGKRR